MQVLVEAELPGGERCSVLLQNAETVRLVGPALLDSSGGGGSNSASSGHAAVGHRQQRVGASGTGSAAAGARLGDVGHAGREGSGGGAAAAAPAPPQAWQAVSVSQLVPGHQLFVLRQEGARHTGVAIQESITER